MFIFDITFIKTHDDFHYYHLHVLYHPTFIVDYVGQFNHGFRTPSSIFYLNSLFYLPLAKYYLFYVPTLLIMGFSNQILTRFLDISEIKRLILFSFYLHVSLYL